MNEQIQTIIDRARVLLAGIADSTVNVTLVGDRIDAHREFHTNSPRLISTLCDAVVDAERRAEEAEAQAAAMRAALTDAEDTIRDQAARFGAGFPCSVIDACEAAIATDAGRALLDRMHAADAERNAARTGLGEFRALALATAAERDALRAEVEALKVERDVADRECDRLRAQVDADRQELTRMAERLASAACGHCGGSGVTYDPDELEVPEGPVPPEMVCPECGGAGAVIVEGVAQRGVMIPDELPRVAPVQGEWKKRPAGTVPWIVHLEAFDTYRKKFGNGQSAERIAERGGFSYREMQCLLAGHYSHECKADHEPVRGWVEKLA